MIKRVFVIGGGPSGLALATDLSQAGISVILLEADSTLGGLAKTIKWGKSQTDLGPHKLYSLDQNLVKKVKGFLGEDQWLIHPKVSSIYLKGRLIKFPPSPIDLLKAFGLGQFFRCGWDFLNKGSKSDQSVSFEARTIERVGQSFYELLFKPLAKKIWGNPKELDACLSESRIQVPSFKEILRTLVKRDKKSTWQANEYFYPRGGLGVLWESLATVIEKNKGEIVRGDPLQALTCQNSNQITGLQTVQGKKWEINPETDWVISTLPLSKLASMIPPPSSIQKAIGSLRLNDLLLNFFKVETEILQKNSWVFVPDESIIFHRVSAQRKFDPSMVEKDLHLICCEVVSYPGKEIASLSDIEIGDRCIKDLEKCGFMPKGSQVKDWRMIRLPSTYPVLTQGYQDSLKASLQYYDQFLNLRSIGRQGSFNYIGSLDAMDIGFGMARQLINGNLSKDDLDKERERTSFYPILD